MELYKRIKSLKLKNEMTQKELSKKLGVSIVSISHWEVGTKNTSIYIGSDSEMSIRCYGKVILGFRIELPDYIRVIT